MTEEYITIAGISTAEYIERHSRFIANAFFCDTAEKASEIIAQQRQKYWDARHNVYAYVLSDGTARFSDDGEPHGTAGKPILDVIIGSGIVNVLVVVTRYFGGILLGTGGLVRAYSTSAKSSLNNADRVQMTPCTEFSIICDYGSHARLVRLIEECGGMIQNTEFTDKIDITFLFRDSDCKAFTDKLCETFASKIEAKIQKNLFFPFKA